MLTTAIMIIMMMEMETLQKALRRGEISKLQIKVRFHKITVIN